MSLTKAVLTSPDENPFGKPVYVRGVLYLDDVPEDDSANDAGDSSVDKPGDADNEEPENGGGNNDADLPPEREEAPSEYENDGNTATIGYGELKTLGAESRYEEIKMLNGMKYYVTDHHVAIIDRHTWNQAQMMLLGGEEARDKKEKKRRANNASPFTNLTYGVDGCNEPMFRIGYNTPLYTYTDERSAKAEP